MKWRTYTPDGRTLDVTYKDGVWTAECDRGRGEADTAAAALRSALQEDAAPLGSGAIGLRGWIEEQAAQLEREVAS
jgi:hypothetical protein